MKRRGRRHLAKVRGHYHRGGGVTHFDSTPWGPINIMDGGRDAPGGPVSPVVRVLLWTLLGAVVVGGIVLIVLFG
jgi:hypothetical protein